MQYLPEMNLIICSKSSFFILPLSDISKFHILSHLAYSWQQHNNRSAIIHRLQEGIFCSQIPFGIQIAPLGISFPRQSFVVSVRKITSYSPDRNLSLHLRNQYRLHAFPFPFTMQKSLFPDRPKNYTSSYPYAKDDK